MTPAPYRIAGIADGRSPLVFTVSHSGRLYPPDFHSLQPVAALRVLEDPHVDRLLLPAATAAGAPLIRACYARAVIDLNRAEEDIDPAMFCGRLDIRTRPGARSRAGLGLIPRLAGGQPIHAGRLPAAVAMDRIATIHRPFHRAVAVALARARQKHGFAILVDCHSMPAPPPPWRGDMVLGDRHGRSATAALRYWLVDALAGLGLDVVLNQPYAGGDIIARHGAPDAGVHAVQLEFNRRSHLDLQTLLPSRGFPALAQALARMARRLAEAAPALALAGALPSLAAE